MVCLGLTPRSREGYEAALGRFLVAFNRIENLISVLIMAALKDLGRTDLIVDSCNVDLSRRIRNLELILLATPYKQVFGEVKAIATERNKIAHGHFDQNPIDGRYAVTGRKPETSGQLQSYDHVTTEHIVALTRRAKDAFDDLRLLEASMMMDRLDIKPLD